MDDPILVALASSVRKRSKIFGLYTLTSGAPWDSKLRGTPAQVESSLARLSASVSGAVLSRHLGGPTEGLTGFLPVRYWQATVVMPFPSSFRVRFTLR